MEPLLYTTHYGLGKPQNMQPLHWSTWKHVTKNKAISTIPSLFVHSDTFIWLEQLLRKIWPAVNLSATTPPSLMCDKPCSSLNAFNCPACAHLTGCSHPSNIFSNTDHSLSIFSVKTSWNICKCFLTTEVQKQRLQQRIRLNQQQTTAHTHSRTGSCNHQFSSFTIPHKAG